MKVIVKHGDVLDETADILICTANPMLSMSGGVNGAILARGGSNVQDELLRHLESERRSWVEPGSVVRTGPGPLSVKHILHAVCVDGLYGSSTDLVAKTFDRALREAAALLAKTVAAPAAATGYGPLSMQQFGAALVEIARRAYPPIEKLSVVLKCEDDAKCIRRLLDAAPA